MYNYYSGVYRVPRHVLLEKIFTLVVVKIHLIQEPTQYWEHNGSFLLVAWWNLYIQQVWIRWGPDRPHGPWYLSPWYLRVEFYTFLDWQPATYLNNIYAFLNYKKVYGMIILRTHNLMKALLKKRNRLYSWLTKPNENISRKISREI